MATRGAILWPVMRSDLARTTDAATYALRCTCNGVTETLTSASLTSDRYYWMSGDSEADASTSGGVGDLVKILDTLLNTHSQGTQSVTLSSDNRITITSTPAITILWANAATTLNAIPFGFAQSDTASATSHTAPNQTRGAWTPLRLPTVDSRDRRRITGATSVSLSGRQRTSRLVEAAAERDLEYRALASRYALSEYADATEPTGTAEDIWRHATSYGRPCRYYEDATSRTSTSFGLYVHRGAARREEIVDRDESAARLLWMVRLALRAYA